MQNHPFKTDKDQIIWSFLEKKAIENSWKDNQLAEFIDVHPHYLSAFKTGKRSFGSIVIRRICKSFQISEKQLLSQDSQKPAESCADLRSQLEEWKKIAGEWERQYYELKKRLD